MADLTKDQLRQQNDTLFANNNSGNITAEDLRTFNEEMIDAVALDNNPSFTGSVLVQGDVSASTYYGDGSNLSGVTSEVPQGTVSSSQQVLDYNIFATTGSNTFTGGNAFNGGIVVNSQYEQFVGDITNYVGRIQASNHGYSTGGSNFTGSFIGDGSQLTNLPVEPLPSGVVSSSAQISDITGSSLVTASFATQTLTFTKGDGTTFGVNIPDVSGSDISALNAFTQSQEELNTTFATTGSNTFVGNQIISGNLEMAPNTLIVANVLDAQEIATPLLLVDTIEVNNATEISVNNDVVVTGILAANSLAAEPADADTFPLEVTDGIGPRITVNSQNEAIASGFNTLIRGNTRIGSSDYSDQVNITAAPLGILANNISSYSTANTNLIANNQLFLRGNSAGVLVSGSLIVSGNLEMAPDTAILGPLFESTGEIATPTLLVDTIEPNTGANITLNGDTIVNGNQTINGSSTTNISAPAQNNEIGIIDMSGASIGGRPYNRTFFGVADYSQFGLNLEDYFAIEYYDSFGYNFGSEFNVNGKQINLQTSASGSGQQSYVRTTDNYDGTSQVSIGSGNKVAMNGFVEVTGTMNVSGETNFGTSGSNDKLGVYGGIVLRSGSGITTDGAFGPAVPFDSPVQFFGGASFNGSNLQLGGNTINQVGYLEIDGTNTSPTQTLSVKDGNGTPRLQVNNATLSGLSGADVLVNGNLLNAGNFTTTGDISATTATNIDFGSNGNYVANFDIWAASYNTIVSNWNHYSINSANIEAQNILNLKSSGNIIVSGSTDFADDIIVNGTNTAPSSTFVVKDGNSTNRLEVNNATLGGLTGVDVNINGKTQITDTLTTIVDVKVGTQLVLLDYLNLNFANDGAAAAGGVPLGGVYHHNSDVKIRIT